MQKEITAHAAINRGRTFHGIRTPGATVEHPTLPYEPWELSDSELAEIGWGGCKTYLDRMWDETGRTIIECTHTCA